MSDAASSAATGSADGAAADVAAGEAPSVARVGSAAVDNGENGGLVAVVPGLPADLLPEWDAEVAHPSVDQDWERHGNAAGAKVEEGDGDGDGGVLHVRSELTAEVLSMDVGAVSPLSLGLVLASNPSAESSRTQELVREVLEEELEAQGGAQVGHGVGFASPVPAVRGTPLAWADGELDALQAVAAADGGGDGGELETTFTAVAAVVDRPASPATRKAVRTIDFRDQLRELLTMLIDGEDVDELVRGAWTVAVELFGLADAEQEMLDELRIAAIVMLAKERYRMALVAASAAIRHHARRQRKLERLTNDVVSMAAGLLSGDDDEEDEEAYEGSAAVPGTPTQPTVSGKQFTPVAKPAAPAAPVANISSSKRDGRFVLIAKELVTSICMRGADGAPAKCTKAKLTLERYEAITGHAIDANDPSTWVEGLKLDRMRKKTHVYTQVPGDWRVVTREAYAATDEKDIQQTAMSSATSLAVAIACAAEKKLTVLPAVRECRHWLPALRLMARSQKEFTELKELYADATLPLDRIAACLSCHRSADTEPTFSVAECNAWNLIKYGMKPMGGFQTSSLGLLSVPLAQRRLRDNSVDAAGTGAPARKQPREELKRGELIG